jgi:hypothetical protein
MKLMVTYYSRVILQMKVVSEQSNVDIVLLVSKVSVSVRILGY